MSGVTCVDVDALAFSPFSKNKLPLYNPCQHEADLRPALRNDDTLETQTSKLSQKGQEPDCLFAKSCEALTDMIRPVVCYCSDAQGKRRGCRAFRPAIKCKEHSISSVHAPNLKKMASHAPFAPSMLWPLSPPCAGAAGCCPMPFAWCMCPICCWCACCWFAPPARSTVAAPATAAMLLCMPPIICCTAYVRICSCIRCCSCAITAGSKDITCPSCICC
mmetsp:Transcript_30979/g.75980  ORF Transcript_30979/g.75980 Transcript_30979/m.75980 type:complete len:219 (-) Transcript_30979:244-900(-)